MTRVVRRPKAKADLEDIFNWIADDSPEAADRYLEKLFDAMRKIGEMPMIGSRRIEAFPDVRVFPVGSHLIIYRYLQDENCVEILRVFHGAQDWIQTSELQ